MNIQTRDIIKSFFLSFCIVFTTNFTMLIFSFWSGTDRLIINIDYFIPIFFLAFKQRILFIISFILVGFYDFLMIFSQIFPFIRISDLLYLLKFSFISSNFYKIYGLLLFVFLIFQIFIILRLYKVYLNRYMLIIFNIFILFYAIHVNLKSDVKGKFWQPEKNQTIASQILNYFEYRNRGFIKTYDVDGSAFQNAKIEGATKSLFAQNKIEKKKVLLIVNESWGVPSNTKIQKQLLASILKNSNIKTIKESSINFNGFTIGGELRELCQKVPNHFNLKNQTTGFEDCLPHKFKSAGYHTVAVHGALGLMYDRQHWYPRAGFEKMLFRDQGLNLPKSRCFSFPGNCDRDIAERIKAEFELNDKIFLYWLTLNTHAIYDKRDLVIDKFNCKKFNVEEDTASCRNLKLQAQFFDTLSNILKYPALKGTRVIVVGDHQPPIIQNEVSAFVDGKVPIIELNVE